MHRQNIITVVLLILIGVVIVGTGYGKGWGPLSRLTGGGVEQMGAGDNLIDEVKAPVAPEIGNGA